MTEENGSLLNGAVAIQVFMGAPSAKRKADKKQIETDADKSMLHLHKDLFDSERFRNITRGISDARMVCRRWEVPGSPFKGGVYLIPNDAISEVVAELEAQFGTLRQRIEDFIAEYPALKAEAKVRLGPLYKESDYPTAEAIRDSFKFEYTFVEFDTPQRLQSISKTLFEQEREKMAEKWREAEEFAFTAMREQFKDLVEHMQERLTPATDGKKKIFRNSMVSNFAEFLQRFDCRNVLNDAELAKLVDEAKELLSGVDPESLRENDGLRDSIQNTFSDMKGQLDLMVTAKPKRRLRLGEDF